ncbi:MAG: Zn-ribbon domain-containing OB-fold protein [Acidimicrobiales bacterium]
MTAGPLPVPAPDRTPETDVFWSATAEGRLLLAQCDACASVIWYPRTLCPDCGSAAVSWIDASGDAVVYSFSVVHRGSGPFRDAVPYVLAYVELAEGPRVLTNVVGCEPEQVHIGQRVRVVFCDTGAGSALYRFAPADQP